LWRGDSRPANDKMEVEEVGFRMAEIKYGELARKASTEVEGLEEPLKSIAYKTILDELIKDAKDAKASGTELKGGPETESISGKRDPIAAFMGRAVDASEFGNLFTAKGSLVEKSLAVLKLARDEFGIEGLTPSQIKEILTRKFRVSGVHAANISRDLGGSPEYVSRISDDKGRTAYLLMVRGEQRLKEVLSEIKTPN